MKRHHWRSGMLNKEQEYEFWLKLKTKEEAMDFICKLDSLMERFINEEGEYSIVKGDDNDREELFIACAEMNTIIKETNVALANFLFSEQQIERIKEYNKFATARIPRHPLDIFVYPDFNTGQYYGNSTESQNEEIELRDFLAHARYINVKTERIEEIIYKQKQEIKSYKQENRSLYRENDRLKQKIRELEGKKDSSDT